MKVNPLFSCVVPVKGLRPYMEEALDSLRLQGMGDELEVIIQDGDVEPDAGQSDALNKGFAKAKGEWLFWLNADDVLLPGALKSLEFRVQSLEFRKVEWIVGDTVYLDEKGVVQDVRTDAKWRPWFGKKLSVWTGGPSAFFRRELWARYGGFDTDIDLWTRWAKAGEKFVGLGDYVWGFRMHEGSKTMGGGDRSVQREELARIDARHGVSSDGFWRNLTRAVNVMDGSWSKRRSDARRLSGLEWRTVGQ